jgi:lysophospholipase L1-like esterase
VFVALLACSSKSTPSGPTVVPANTSTTVSPPQIACPADLIVPGVAAATQAVTFSAPTVTDGTAPVAVTCSPASGDPFPLGTTAVSCIASDATARKATCSFNVTLKGFTIAMRKIDAFGDSLTEGQNALPFVETAVPLTLPFVDTANAYPTKLQARISAVYPSQGITVANYGQGGQPAEATVDAIRGTVPTDQPDVVLLLTGYNNLLGGGCRETDGPGPACGKAIDFVAGAILDCIRKARESSNAVSYVFVSTLTPPGPLVPPTTDRRIKSAAITALNSRIAQIAAAQRATLVDTYPTFLGHEPDYVSIDGLHLRPAGYQAIADAFFAAIQATVAQTPLFGFTAPR